MLFRSAEAGGDEFGATDAAAGGEAELGRERRDMAEALDPVGKEDADVNNDGKVNVEDVKEVKKRVSKKVKELADVDKDGDVDLADVKEAVKKVSKKAKKVIEPIIEEIAPKKRGRKPKA